MEAAVRETLRFRSGPDGRSKHLWSGLGGGLRGRSPLTAAGRACLSGLPCVPVFPRSMNNPGLGSVLIIAPITPAQESVLNGFGAYEEQ